MSLNGNLEELRPSEIFQLISLTRKSGKLVLSRGDQQGIVVFRRGRVVFAASNSLHSTLDKALLEGRVGADTAFIAKARKRDSRKVTDSGSFVVELHDTDNDALEEVVRSQIESTVHELIEWKSGTFVFGTVDLPEIDHIALESGWLKPGVKAEALILNALTKLDETRRGQWKQDIDNAGRERLKEEKQRRRQSAISAAFEVLVDEDTGEITWAPSGPGRQTLALRNLEGLRSIVSEMAQIKGISPSLTAEVALLILRYAAQVLSRGVLFAVGRDSVRGIGQFGLDFGGESADERVRNLELPLDVPSVFARVLSTGRSYRGKLEPTKWNRYLIEGLGGLEPMEATVVPLMVEASPVYLLYGDNLPEASVIATAEGVEILMHEIGLAVEKARLERRLKILEAREY